METSFENKPSSSPASESNELDNSPEADAQELMNLDDSPTDVQHHDASGGMALGEVQGEVDQKDVLIPYLNLVHGTGRLSKAFPKGTWVYGSDLKIAEADQPLSLTVMSIRKFYEDWNADYVAGEKLNTYQTLDEVRAAGRTTEWVGKTKPTARPVAVLTLLIKQPEDVDSPRFSYAFDGNLYAPAMWYVRSTAYPAAKKVFSAAGIDLKSKGLLKGEFTVFSTERNAGGNDVFVPQMSLTGENSDEFVEFIKTNFG